MDKSRSSVCTTKRGSAVAYTGIEKLEHIKSSPFPIDKAVDGLNVTFTDRGVANITEEDLQNAMTLTGDTLSYLINNAKQ